MLQQREVSQIYSIFMILIKIIIIITIMMALAQNPISTKSHIWDFVRQYGIMFLIIIIIIYRKVKVSTLQYVEMCVHWGEPSGSASTCKVSPSSGLPLLNGKRILQFHRLA